MPKIHRHIATCIGYRFAKFRCDHFQDGGFIRHFVCIPHFWPNHVYSLRDRVLLLTNLPFRVLFRYYRLTFFQKKLSTSGPRWRLYGRLSIFQFYLKYSKTATRGIVKFCTQVLQTMPYRMHSNNFSLRLTVLELFPVPFERNHPICFCCVRMGMSVRQYKCTYVRMYVLSVLVHDNSNTHLFLSFFLTLKIINLHWLGRVRYWWRSEQRWRQQPAFCGKRFLSSSSKTVNCRFVKICM